ncbi:hypothetical protein K1719_047468 [Acacia pycnantha]|nr:hypothetical protein K1719_047468 [Acacia pycnantha]
MPSEIDPFKKHLDSVEHHNGFPILQLYPLSSPKSITILPRNSEPSLVPLPHLLSLIPKCASLRELKQIHGYAMKTHIKDDISVLTKLINFCTSNPTTASLGYAHKMFDGISNPDIVLFNTMARGYARFENPLQAIVLLAQLLSSGLVPDDYTFSTLLKACGRVKASEEGKQVHCLAIKLGVNGNVYVRPTFINMYTACNDIDSARRVFDKISEPCVVTYNALITSYARNSQPNEALALFRELQERGLKPTDVTMLVALSSCALLGALDLGKWIHEYIKKNGFDQYVKAWSAMIVAYATHGHGFKALSMLEEMDKVKVQPDEITFLGILYACSHNGLVEKGYEYYRRMIHKYGIVPGIKHYGSSDSRIFELDDTHGGDYVILSNLCARSGKWEDVNFLRKMMKDRRAVKVPGCSSIEVNNVVHEFFSGDEVHSTSTALHHALDELVKELKLAGYVPDTSLVFHADMGDEEKKLFLDITCSCGDYW